MAFDKAKYQRENRYKYTERIKAYRQKYNAENREKINASLLRRKKERKVSDLSYLLTEQLRTRIREALYGNYKSGKSIELLGCSIDELKTHLENQFAEGMSWKNHGHTGWHIDHIIPCASFDLSKPEEQRKCFHYTNLQPLWWKDNIVKGNKIV